MLNEEGLYRVYDIQGDYQQYTLGGEATELGVIDAHIYDNGLVAMIGNLTLLEVKGWEGGKPLTLANPGTSPCLSYIGRSHDDLRRSSRAPEFMDDHTAGLYDLQARRSVAFRGFDHLRS